MEHLRTKFWIKWDDLEELGVSCSFLKTTKYRGDGFIENTAKTKHVKKLIELLELQAANTSSIPDRKLVFNKASSF